MSSELANISPFAEVSLGDIAQSIIAINPGATSGSVCFPSPWGPICIDVNTSGQFTKTLTTPEDSSREAFGAILKDLVDQYSLFSRVGVNAPGLTYRATKNLSVVPAGSFASLGLIDVNININF
jgi:hypothetical protein